MADGIKKGTRVSVLEDDQVFEGTVTGVKKGVYSVHFDNGEDGDYKLNELTVLPDTEAEKQQEIEDREAEIARKEAELKEKEDAFEAAEKERADAEAEAQANVSIAEEAEQTITITNTVSIPQSKVSMASQIAADPVKLRIEEERQKVLIARRQENRTARAKAKPRTPIQVREKYLKGKLKRVKQGTVHTYRREQIKVMAEELRVIQTNPEAWKPGNFVASKPKGSEQYLEGLDLGDAPIQGEE